MFGISWHKTISDRSTTKCMYVCLKADNVLYLNKAIAQVPEII